MAEETQSVLNQREPSLAVPVAISQWPSASGVRSGGLRQQGQAEESGGTATRRRGSPGAELPGRTRLNPGIGHPRRARDRLQVWGFPPPGTVGICRSDAEPGLRHSLAHQGALAMANSTASAASLSATLPTPRQGGVAGGSPGGVRPAAHRPWQKPPRQNQHCQTVCASFGRLLVR